MKKEKASITVEAALCFPLFFIAVISLCYLFIYLRVEYAVERSMYLTAENVSSYGLIIRPVSDEIKNYVRKADAAIEENLSGMLADSIKNEISSNVPGISELNLENFVLGMSDSLIVERLLYSQIPEGVWSYIDKGREGIDCTGSVFIDSNDCIVIVCSYRLSLPFGMFPGLGISVTQKLRYRYFCGTREESLLELVDVVTQSPTPVPENKDTPVPEASPISDVTGVPTSGPTPTGQPGGEEGATGTATPGLPITSGGENKQATPTLTGQPEASTTPSPTEEEEKVLITESGYAYHFSYSCPTLNIKPEKIMMDNVSQRRNEGGGKYYPCEICIKKNIQADMVYITADGDRYHIKNDCPGLKRTISEVPISQVGRRRPCKRCGSYRK